MKKIVRRKPRLSRSLLLFLGATILLTTWQGKAASSEANNITETEPSKIVFPTSSLEIDLPELPPLGDPNQYLPLEENTRLVIKLSERRVYVYQGNQVLTSYPIAIGKRGWETPTGNFQIIQMLRDPAWQHPWTGKVVPPGPNNPLGQRWIGFWTDGKNYIGFHGTTAEQLIGQAVSHGCVRMRNKDVRDLFEQVAIGNPVIVQP
ncbi:MAG: L,D-transpeptidase [Xenococcaceae cyanobacterium]